MALTNKLSAIGDAIRAKNGTTELMTLDAMPAAIEAIETGGELSAEALVITDRCDYKFAYDGWTWFADEFGNRITSENITSAEHMFYCSSVKSVPFDINFEETEGYSNQCRGMFYNSGVQEMTGVIRNARPLDFSHVFMASELLRELPVFENLDLGFCQSTLRSDIYANFINNCYSLRSIPEDFLKRLWSRATDCGVFSLYNSMYKLYSLDAINKLSPFAARQETSDALGGLGNDCHRLKSLTFDTELPDFSQVDFTLGWEDLLWSNQTLDLSNYTGWSRYPLETLNIIIGGCFTAENEVSDTDTYNALKDTDDWWTSNSDYSRYNRISAVETINSLPNTNGTGNVIKFLGSAGRYTDGGRIGDMTEEEIAVATAKGWTVSFA